VALAPEVAVHVSWLSGNVAAGLRFGFVAAPAGWVPRPGQAIRVPTWNAPGVVTAIGCAWLEDGTASRLESGTRQDAALRPGLLKGRPACRMQARSASTSGG